MRPTKPEVIFDNRDDLLSHSSSAVETFEVSDPQWLRNNKLYVFLLSNVSNGNNDFLTKIFFKPYEGSFKFYSGLKRPSAPNNYLKFLTEYDCVNSVNNVHSIFSVDIPGCHSGGVEIDGTCKDLRVILMVRNV